MPSSRIIIFLAVIVLVLFGISLALSARSGRDQSTVPQAAWIDGLKNVFLGNQKLDIHDITSPCLQGNAFVIEQGKRCEAKIGESSKAVRKAKLSVKEGAKCTIDFVPAAGEQALPVHSSSGSVELSVMGKGGTLTITCTDAGGENTAQVNIE
jgi:hypothetical protein